MHVLPLQQNNSPGAAIAAILLVELALVAAFSIPILVGRWAMFKKAGREGWPAIVPVYKWIVTLELINRPWWWVFLVYAPFVNIVFQVLIYLDLSKAFGKSEGYAVGLFFLPFVFYPILGFSRDVRYYGPPNPPQGYPPGWFPPGGYPGYPPPGYGPPGYPPPGYPPPGYPPPGYAPPGYPPPPGYSSPQPPPPPPANPWPPADG
ncbi:MAG TPA: DUF5684 domain-containing protein [Actinomycetota bacterium]|nr:DUF5684 domain-containing protein [Actinomycetota bacterium]